MAKRRNMSPLSIIVAVDSEGGFGKEGKIPWHFSEDLKYFKETTKDNICIMGRRTYEDLLELDKAKRKRGKIKNILPGRESYVVTSKKDYKAKGATAVTSIRQAVQSIDENDKREIFILGGRRMFIEALSWANKVYMTIIKDKRYDCDVFFPVQALNSFKISEGNQTNELYFITYIK